ncbi:MAG: MerR family transcriptional regulator [Spirochaetaceae bacterium]|jgi:DNA-binding transcriptional MerR regulator|nr:MerR family transcriptional regulator [Spirochaetaceae bacterium]
MRTFTIGDVEDITGIKAHTLRYWEEVIPSISPHKDPGNRRVYTERDIHTMQRIKHLTRNKNLPIEAARTRLLEDAAALHRAGDDSRAAVQTLRKLRTELLEIYGQIKAGSSG